MLLIFFNLLMAKDKIKNTKIMARAKLHECILQTKCFHPLQNKIYGNILLNIIQNIQCWE